MKSKFLLVIALPVVLTGAFLYNSNPQDLAFSDSAIAFTNVNVLPMTGEIILRNHTVVVDGQKIVMVTPNRDMKLSDKATIIDGSGKYLMPGLAEMHGHVPPTTPPPNAPAYMTMDYVEHTLFLYTAAGITTVRGMLGWENQLELKEKVSSGELIGPNLYLAGPSFNGNSIGSPQQAIDKAKQQKEEGWDLLKIHPGLTLEEYDAMATTANEIGITFGGHVPSEVGLLHAIEMGQLTMDHLDGYVAYLSAFEGEERDQKMEEIIQTTIENDVWVVPTQALWETIIGAADYEAMRNYDELKYIPKQLLASYNAFVTNNIDNNPNFNADQASEHAELRQHLLGKMNAAGVKILMGTDAPQLFSVPGFSIHRELALMAEAGMTPYEIIKTGTLNVGEYFSDRDAFGTITKGQRADLILVDQNPFEDIGNLKSPSGVMIRGNWMPKAMIDAKLKEIEDYYNK